MKDIYEMLNEIKLEEYEFVEMEVDEVEIKRVKKNLNKFIKNNNKRKGKWIAAASIASAVIITLSMSFPTYAKQIPIIGDIFEALENSIYKNYKESANEINITKESNGISITVNDAVFDGTNVVLTYTIESDKDLGDNIGFADRIEIVGNNTTGMVSGYDFIKVNDNTYVGKEKISVLDYVDNPKEDIRLNINIKRIYMIEESEEVKGKWNFNLSLNATEGETKVVNLQSEKAGITAIINRITVNPMSISMKYSQKVSEEVRENYDEVYMELEIRDDLGNVYSNEGNGASGDVNLNMTYSETIEKLKDGASKLIITPKFILKDLGEVNYVEQESKNGFTGESSISNAETYECVERKELILDEIIVDLNR